MINRKWAPLPGPQTQAINSEADIIFYGGAAGGGKTDLLLGTAGTKHYRAIIFRRVFPSLQAVIDRSQEIYPLFGGKYNESLHRWKFAGGQRVRFASLQHEKNVTDYQGQPHDIYGFDEITEFTEFQFRFVTGWNRTTRKGQRCRVICTGNPPTDPDGEWIVQFFGPWLDPQHPNPAAPGELRWYGVVNGIDIAVNDGREFVIKWHENKKDYEIIYEFDRSKYKPTDIIKPKSRTFIPALLQDNPYLLNSGYMATLQALPEPLRSKMLYGDFQAGREDAAWQVIPSEWVLAAQERWKIRVATVGKPKTPMSGLGVDVARGGKDKTILSPRFDNFYDDQVHFPGTSTPNGQAVAGHVLTFPGLVAGTGVKVDIIGVGGSPHDFIKEKHTNTYAMNGAAGTEARDKSGLLSFVNQRAQWYWQFRESLDPASGQDICLPPSRTLFVDLCAPRWKLTARGIQIESKDDIIARIKRSTDEGDSCIYASALPYFEGMGILEVMREQYEELQKQKAEQQGVVRNGW